MPRQIIAGDPTWLRSRHIHLLLRIFGPQSLPKLREKLGLPSNAKLESTLLACDECGFLLYEDDDGRVGAARVVVGR